MHQYKQHIPIAIILVLAVLSIYIVFPLILAMLSALLLSIIFRPLHEFLLSRFHAIGVKYEGFAAAFTCTCIILLFLIPLLFGAALLVLEVKSFIPYLTNENYDLVLSQLSEYTGSIDIYPLVSSASAYIKNYVSSFATNIPFYLISLFVTLILSYYFLKDGKEITKFIFIIIPLPRHEQAAITQRFSSVTNALVYGQLVTAVIQGILAGIGYWMFGIPTPLLWAVVTVFAALIPFIGAASVWLPAGLYLVFTGSQTSGWWLGIGMLIYGAVVVSMIDNLIRPYLVSDAAKVHPAIVIVGAFGGALSIGFLGIFLGPLCLVLFVTFVELLFARV